MDDPTKSERGNLRFHKGAWRIALRAGRHPGGKARWVYRTVNEPNTKAGERIARKAMAVLAEEADRLREIDAPAHITLLGACERYHTWGMGKGGRTNTGWAPDTVRNYARMHGYVAASALAGRKLDRLTAPALTAFYEGLWDAHGRDAALQCHRYIHAAIGKAVADGLAAGNPASYARKPPAAEPRKEGGKRLTPAKLATVLAHLEATDPGFYTWVRVAASTGARRSTLAGFRWSDVDLDTGLVEFSRAAVRGTQTDTAGYTVKELKAGGSYRLTLDADTLVLLRAWRIRTADLGSPWVFPHHADPSAPVSVASMSVRWYRLRAKLPAELEGVRMHDLRHFVATQLFGLGFDPVAVAARLGHKNPATTMRIYASEVAARDQQVAASMGSLLAA